MTDNNLTKKKSTSQYLKEIASELNEGFIFFAIDSSTYQPKGSKPIISHLYHINLNDNKEVSIQNNTAIILYNENEDNPDKNVLEFLGIKEIYNENELKKRNIRFFNGEKEYLDFFVNFVKEKSNINGLPIIVGFDIENYELEILNRISNTYYQKDFLEHFENQENYIPMISLLDFQRRITSGDQPDYKKETIFKQYSLSFNQKNKGKSFLNLLSEMYETHGLNKIIEKGSNFIFSEIPKNIECKDNIENKIKKHLEKIVKTKQTEAEQNKSFSEEDIKNSVLEKMSPLIKKGIISNVATMRSFVEGLGQINSIPITTRTHKNSANRVFFIHLKTEEGKKFSVEIGVNELIYMQNKFLSKKEKDFLLKSEKCKNFIEEYINEKINSQNEDKKINVRDIFQENPELFNNQIGKAFILVKTFLIEQEKLDKMEILNLFKDDIIIEQYKKNLNKVFKKLNYKIGEKIKISDIKKELENEMNFNIDYLQLGLSLTDYGFSMNSSELYAEKEILDKIFTYKSSYDNKDNIKL